MNKKPKKPTTTIPRIDNEPKKAKQMSKALLAYISESLGHSSIRTTQKYLKSFEREYLKPIRKGQDNYSGFFYFILFS